MTSDFLAGLDAAVESRCACLCGRPITSTSSSVYFASEGCAADWHYRQCRGLRDQFAAAFEFLRRLGQALADAVRQFTRQFTDLLYDLHRQIRRLLPAQPPTDQRERALWLRQHRNTGPARGARVPRTIGPPPGFSTMARSRRRVGASPR
jgi:hypothetical protein